MCCRSHLPLTISKVRPHLSPPASPPRQPCLPLTPSCSPRSCNRCTMSKRPAKARCPAGRGCTPGACTAAAAALPAAHRPTVHGCLSCCPYRKTVRVKIVDEEEYERQENFFIALGEPKWMERGISGVRSFMKNNPKQIESSLQTPNPENITPSLLLPLLPFLLLMWMDGL